MQKKLQKHFVFFSDFFKGVQPTTAESKLKTKNIFQQLRGIESARYLRDIAQREREARLLMFFGIGNRFKL